MSARGEELAAAVAGLGALPVSAGDVPEPLSAERVAEIRNRRLDEVTAGPWLVADGEGGRPVVYVEQPMDDGRIGARVLLLAEGASEADVQFVASARRSVPELVDEVERLQAQVAELEAERERRRLRLIALQNDALSMRGSLSPMGEDRKVPFPLGETLTPAVDWLIARVSELEALTPARHQTCRVCGAGYTFGEPCTQCEFRARMAAESQARVRLPRRLGHDLPETGGVQ